MVVMVPASPMAEWNCSVVLSAEMGNPSAMETGTLTLWAKRQPTRKTEQ
jgi:hypothetical protein